MSGRMISIYLVCRIAKFWVSHSKPTNTQLNDFYADYYGPNLMRSLPMRAVLFDPDDPTAFTLRVLQLDENRRKDILLLNFFRTRWGYEQLLKEAPDLL